MTQHNIIYTGAYDLKETASLISSTMDNVISSTMVQQWFGVT